MLKEKNLEQVKDSLPQNIQNNIIYNQDNTNQDSNLKTPFFYITKKERDFIAQNNKLFFNEFKIVYNKNIELKNKLNILNAEKKKLYDVIIKMEQKIKNSININNNEINNSDLKINNNMDSITPYKKKKRIRRKKNEINYRYSCSFPNCDKSYPTKCSLNMHIKLKHRKNSTYLLNDGDKK